jgi:hypothetical protein
MLMFCYLLTVDFTISILVLLATVEHKNIFITVPIFNDTNFTFIKTIKRLVI